MGMLMDIDAEPTSATGIHACLSYRISNIFCFQGIWQKKKQSSTITNRDTLLLNACS